MNKIRVLLIEDNRLLREGLTAMLNGQPDIEVVAALGNGENAVLKAQEWKPQVVLLDLGLRSQNSLRLVELVKQESPKVKLIVMDLIPVQADIVEFVKAGVSGFLLKDATFEDFLRTIPLGGGRGQGPAAFLDRVAFLPDYRAGGRRGQGEADRVGADDQAGTGGD
jgi:DNA-binding NarL/FixJ family response regulator